MNKITKITNKCNQAAGSSAIVPTVSGSHILTNKAPALYETKVTIGTFTQLVGNAALAFGNKLFTFPKGKIVIHKAIMELTYVASGAQAVVPDIGLGSVVGSTAVADLGSVGDTSEDIVNGYSGTITNGVNSVTMNKIVNGELDIKDGTTTAIPCYLNVAGTWTSAVTLTFTGVVTVIWSNLND